MSKEKVAINYNAELEKELKAVKDLEDQYRRLETEGDKQSEQVKKYEKENKLLFFGHEDKQHLGKHGTWKPNPPQRKLIEAWKDPNHKVFTYTGANRIGKTLSGLFMILTSILGRFPWEPEELGPYLHEQLGWELPIKIRWIGQDWEKHVKTVLIPEIKNHWPKSIDVESRKNNVGVEAYWNCPRGTFSLEIMSNKSESELFEGWNGHLVVWDEPPTRNNRVASARGLIDHNGREMFCMTLLKEAWVNKDVIHATLDDGSPDLTVFNINGEISQNVGYGITQSGIDQFAKTLTEEEKDARLRGIPSYMSGLILPLDRQVHLIRRPTSGIPLNYLIDIAIDIHPAKPQHILFMATDERNIKYVCFEIVGHGDGDWVGDQIVKKIKRHNLRVNRIIIDPFSKGDNNNEFSTYDKIDRILSRNNLYLEVASKDKDDGIIALREMFMTKNNIPGLFIYNDLVVAIRQLENWMYEEKKDDQKGKASKVDDDQCENLYRLALMGTEYFHEEDEHQPEYEQYFTGNNITGY